MKFHKTLGMCLMLTVWGGVPHFAQAEGNAFKRLAAQKAAEKKQQEADTNLAAARGGGGGGGVAPILSADPAVQNAIRMGEVTQILATAEANLAARIAERDNTLNFIENGVADLATAKANMNAAAALGGYGGINDPILGRATNLRAALTAAQADVMRHEAERDAALNFIEHGVADLATAQGHLDVADTFQGVGDAADPIIGRVRTLRAQRDAALTAPHAANLRAALDFIENSVLDLATAQRNLDTAATLHGFGAGNTPILGRVQALRIDRDQARADLVARRQQLQDTLDFVEHGVADLATAQTNINNANALGGIGNNGDPILGRVKTLRTERDAAQVTAAAAQNAANHLGGIANAIATTAQNIKNAIDKTRDATAGITALRNDIVGTSGNDLQTDLDGILTALRDYLTGKGVVNAGTMNLYAAAQELAKIP